ncbi:hypothetical protein MY5147_007103 [Beauveria neobassiana]|uniref:Uncharacterized protein n=1 Tax=Beauveria bassiana D1-5 TaxID=1245745 RepID=A0A0A2V7U2_BEABA|nr:hypothetical protein BBAD15_g10817 [Beauveria bassiana D1-5]
MATTHNSYLLRVILLGIVGDQVRRWLGRELARGVLAERLTGLLGFGVADFFKRNALVSTSGHGNKLIRVTEAFKRDKLKDIGPDRGGSSQQAVVTQDSSTLATNSIGDGVPLGAAQYDASKLLVECNAIIEVDILRLKSENALPSTECA